MQKLRLAVLVSLAVTFFGFAYAQTQSVTEVQAIYKAKVTSVTLLEPRGGEQSLTTAHPKKLEVVILDGPYVGATKTIEESVFEIQVGDMLYLSYLKTFDGTEYFSVQEPYRIPVLIWLLGLFVVCVLLFGGKQGFLALVALAISFGGVFTFLFPKLLTTDSVVLVATVAALVSLFIVMFVTHGRSRLTVSAFLGCSASVFVTILLAQYAVTAARLTGFASEESVYLNLATSGRLDFVALLIGGIIIGVIGVIDDIAITQASVVNELHAANPAYSRRTLYIKALKVGKDHMGAVINTLILAYTGASLPLVLLLYTSTSPVIELINREAIATEIIRAIVGSIGLLAAVPLTTLIAVWLMYGHTEKHTHAHTHGHTV